jgi:hypothetical protein
MGVKLMSNCGLVRILVLRFVIPYACTLKVYSCEIKLHPPCGACFGVSYV